MWRKSCFKWCWIKFYKFIKMISVDIKIDLKQTTKKKRTGCRILWFFTQLVRTAQKYRLKLQICKVGIFLFNLGYSIQLLNFSFVVVVVAFLFTIIFIRICYYSSVSRPSFPTLDRWEKLSKSVVFGEKMYFIGQNGPKADNWILSIFKFKNEFRNSNKA